MFLVMTAASGWLGYQFNWIRQRHEFLSCHAWVQVSSGFDADVKAPGLLWMFGEEGKWDFSMMFFDVTRNRTLTLSAVEEQTLQEARRLFPEAHISGFVLPIGLPDSVGDTPMTEDPRR